MARFISFMKRAAWLLAAAVFVSANLTPGSLVLADVAPPLVAGIQPVQAANDVDTPVEISGSGFSDSGGDPQVFIGDFPLTEVKWVDADTLAAVVPWGAKAGVYALRVVNPDGGEASLPAAFTVTDGVGQWNSNAIDGGPVRQVIPIVNTPGLLYAYSQSTSGIYKSSDYGENWTTVGHSGGEILTYDRGDPQIMYLGMFKSGDGGATWQGMLPDNHWPGTDDYPSGYTRTFPDPAHSGTLFLATADIPQGGGSPSGLLRSEDFGQTWEAAESGLLSGDTNVTAIEYAGAKIYLGTRDGNLYQSADAGDSWQRIGTDNVLPSIGLLRVNPYQSDELWITTHYSVSATAQIARMDLDTQALTPLSGWTVDHYPKTLEFLDQTTAVIASEWDNGWITRDNGGKWDLFQPSSGKPGYWLALDPWDDTKNTFYFSDEQYGVQKTSDGGLTWSPANLGLHAMAPDFLEIDPANPARVYAKIIENGWPGIFVSADGGQSWDFSSLEPFSGGIRPVVSMVAVNGGRLFVGAHGNEPFGYGPQLFISDDQGANWERVNADPSPVNSAMFHMPFMVKADPQNPGVLLMAAILGDRTITTDQYVSEIYRSADNGDTWQRVNLAQQIGHEVNNVGNLAFDPHDSDIAYAVGSHEILKSTDNGLTWAVVYSDNNQWLNGPIAVEPVTPYRVYVKNLVSTDGGSTWDAANLPINVNQMLFLPDSDTLYIAGWGLAVSYDGGSNWTYPEGALASAQINGLAVGRSGQRTVVYVGTPGGEEPAPRLSFMRLDDAGTNSFEAGVYRLTEVRYPTFLPMIRR